MSKNDMSKVYEIFQTILTMADNDMNESSMKDRTNEELKHGCLAFILNRAPGPERYTVCFYQFQREIIKEDMLEVKRSFFHFKYFLKEFNNINIALIPKVNSPSTIKQY